MNRPFEALYRQVETVVAPVAAEHGGKPMAAVRLELQQAWHHAFGAGLGEPYLSRCALAVQERTPWSWVLWNDDWRDPRPYQRRR